MFSASFSFVILLISVFVQIESRGEIIPFHTDLKTRRLRVADQPKIVPFVWPDGIEAGRPIASVDCVARGAPVLSFRWTKDGHEIHTSARIIIQSDAEFSSLEIRKLEPEDRGNYSCFVSNGFGSDSHSAELLVKRETVTSVCSFPHTLNL